MNLIYKDGVVIIACLKPLTIFNAEIMTESH